MLFYCKRCGRMLQENYGQKEQICDCCKHKLEPVPEQFLRGKSKCVFKEDLKEQFIQQYVKSSPEFDQELFDHRAEHLLRRSQEWAQSSAIHEGRDKGNKFGVECPYCHATNVKKISGFSKAGNVALFGVFAMGKVSKQWHCNNCGSDF